MKKRYYVLIFSIFLMILTFSFSASIAYALPYETETSGPNGELVPTQQVYEPSRKIVIPYNMPVNEDESSTFNAPEDMFYDEETNSIFIADTGNKRVVRLNYDGTDADFIYYGKEDEALIDPRGVSCNDDYLVVADRQLEKVIVYDKETLTYVDEITRPDSTLIGATSTFVPTKVCVDNRGNLYIVSEGNTKGVMQLNLEGEFAGYIGANETPSSFLSWIQDLFGINNDDGLLAQGQSVSNIALDSNGLVYTVTNQSATAAVKKLNTTGVSIMSPSMNFAETTQVCIDSSGNIYSVQNDGYITIFDSYGSLLFRFGGVNNEEVLGALKNPIAVNVTSNHELLVLDREQNMVILYTPTHFANLVFDAVDYYKDGLYLEGEDAWLEVLKYNNKFILAYKALARANMKKGNYDLALEQFKLAEDKQGYSEAYWQIRDTWLRSNLIWIIVPILVLCIGIYVVKLVDRKKPMVFASIKSGFNRANQTHALGDFTYVFRYMRRPRDATYEMKYKGKTSVIGATILYLFFVVIQILQVYLKGYLFNNTNVYDSNALEIILLSTLPLILLVICNYFVSNVTDGEGKFKQVYIGMIYSLSPYLVLSIPIFLISNVLTYNEQVIYDVLIWFTYIWSGINIFLTIMELHDFTFWKAVKNILLTIVCFILVIAFAFILYMLAYQLVGYIISVCQELAL